MSIEPVSTPFIILSEWFFLGYFLGINFYYLALNLIAIFGMKNYVTGKLLTELPQIYSGIEPPVSVLVPAYNEEITIIASIQSILQLNYPNFEIIIVNDGSQDQTLSVLKLAFDLLPFPEAYRAILPTQQVKQVYRSILYPNLRLIDKANGGKADALNAGINISRYPFFCSLDADCILQRTSLQRIVYPFIEDQRVVAVGGTVRIANGCRVENGFLQRVGLPSNYLALFQVVEYLRAFLFGRLGWSVLGGLLIISGAFGVFRKQTVIEVGGYRTDTVGEDMELVVRLHRLLRKSKQDYRMVFMPDPVSWTEVPENFNTLRLQRSRWQRGLCESLFGNLGLFFSRNGGVAGWLAFPLILLFECLGPLFEVSGYFLMLAFYGLDLISQQILFTFFFAATSLGLLLSMSSLLLEELSFRVYAQPKQLFCLLFAAVLENFGYRQLNSWWRFQGFCLWLFGKKRAWGEMKRNGAWQKD